MSKQERLKAIGRVFAAILLGAVILNCTAVVVMNADNLPTFVQSHSWTRGFLSHTTMWVMSILLIMIISRGKISSYGFRIGGSYRMTSMILLGAATGIAHSLMLKIIPEGADSLELDYTFGQVVIFVWLYASISEEILTRGLIQGFLAPLTRYGFHFFGIRLSLPVIVSALFFGLMHLAVLTTGVTLLPVISYVIFATVLGLIAGYHREQTGSIIPAIIVHMFGNIGGYTSSLLF